MGTEFYDRALARNTLRQLLDAQELNEVLEALSPDEVERVCSMDEVELRETAHEVEEFIMGRKVDPGRIEKIWDLCSKLKGTGD
jgi:hypothetical protein